MTSNDRTINTTHDQSPEVAGREEHSGDMSMGTQGGIVSDVECESKPPTTFQEAFAVLRGEGTVKPDYERVATTMAVVRRLIIQDTCGEDWMLFLIWLYPFLVCCRFFRPQTRLCVD